MEQPVKSLFRISSQNEGVLSAEIQNLFEPLREFGGIQIFIHGSYADNTMTAFSDIDDFIVIDDVNLSKIELQEIESKLKEIEEKFYELDPLQHHGHWKVYTSELKDYNNGVIPLFILESAICIKGENKIEASINYFNTFNTLSGSISGFCRWIDVLFDDYFHDRLNIYNLKRLVGSVVLLVPLLNQIKGINIDKRTAILNSGDLFSLDAQKLIQWATDLRSNWGELIYSGSFQEFVSKQPVVGLENWQKYAESNSPVLSACQLSKIKPSKGMVENFITECVTHLDESTLVPLKSSDYVQAYELVEEYSIELGALAVGQFGQVKSPGISDLDVFICFEDKDYKIAQEKVRLFIEHSKEFCHVFTHPPICVAESMMPSLPYLHTINNLKIQYKKKNFDFKPILSEKYIDLLNILWTIFILPGLGSVQQDLKWLPLRGLFLRLKNAHTSIDNLSALCQISTDAQAESNMLRDMVFNSFCETRLSVEKSIKFTYEKLSNFGVLKNSSSCVIGRRLILREGTYSTLKVGGLTVYSLPPLLYRLLKDYFYGRNKELKLYLSALNDVSKIANDLGANMPVVSLLREYEGISTLSFKKRIVFGALSYFPYSVLTKIIR
ncbi:nucleotidyltransferase domain-containing protein [Persicobacter psychrovividus]